MKIFAALVCMGLLLVGGETPGECQEQLQTPPQNPSPTRPIQPFQRPAISDAATPGPAPIRPYQRPTIANAPAVRVPIAATPRISDNPIQQQASRDLRNALRKLQKAESDDDKSDAKSEIKEALEGQYDAFLEQNQAQVDALFDRLKALEEQLERRRDAKDRLVKLKLEMLVSQAEGLGWPADNRMGLSPFQNTQILDPRLNLPPAQLATPPGGLLPGANLRLDNPLNAIGPGLSPAPVQNLNPPVLDEPELPRSTPRNFNPRRK